MKKIFRFTCLIIITMLFIMIADMCAIVSPKETFVIIIMAYVYGACMAIWVVDILLEDKKNES